MAVDLEERLRRYGGTFERAVAASETTPRRIAASPRRHRGRWLVAAVLLVGVLVLAVVAFPRGHDDTRVTSGGTDRGLVRYRNDDLGFSLEFPSSWHRATTPLVPTNDDARELVSIGTYELPTGSTTCPTGPQNALAALPPDGAFVWIQQRADYMFAPARATYPPSGTAERFDNSILCVTGSDYEHWIIPFTEGNRSLRMVVAFGPDATTVTKDAAWRAVNSLHVDAAQPSAIPNHVSPETYAAQADGASEVVRLADGPYATAVREDDRICIDLRPSGQPTGPRFCDIPANAPWPTPVLAAIVTLDGADYVVGVAAADTVSQVDVNGTSVPLSARQVFPTLRFFAAPVDDGATITAHTDAGPITTTPARS